MASKTPQELLAQQVASLSKHQSLNPVESSEFNQTFDSDSSFIGAARRAIIDNAKDDVFDYMGDIKAVVLHAWREDSTLLGYDKKVVVHVKARVPGLDFVPLPVGLPLNNDREDKLADWPAINRHDTFVAKEEYLPLPSPGDIIEVSFGNPNQRRDPVYLGILSKNKPPGSFGSPPSQNFHSGECKEERNESFDQETKPTETPAGEVPETKPSKIEPIPPDKPPKIGVYTGSGGAYNIYKPEKDKWGGVFKARGDYSWVKDACDAGIDYINFRVDNISYTKSMSGGRKVPDEAAYVFDEAQRLGFENFEVHMWACPIFFTSEQKWEPNLSSGTFKNTVLRKVKRLATKYANYVNDAQGKVTDFHYNRENYHQGNKEWKKRTRSQRAATKDYNTIVDITFVNTFRSVCKYPVRLWWNGWSLKMASYDSEKVFSVFDVMQPQTWSGAKRLQSWIKWQGNEAPSNSQKKYSFTIPAGNYPSGGASKRGRRQKLVKDIDPLLIENKGVIWGLELYTLSSFLYRSYEDIPTLPQRIKAFKDQTGWDE